MSYYNLSNVPESQLYVHAFILGVIMMVGCCLNAIVVFLVIVDRRLRYRSTIATLSVVFVDFLLTLFYHGVAFTSLLLGEWPYRNDRYETCRLYSVMSPYFIYVRWSAMCLIAVDRFLTVRFPFHYQRHNKHFLILLTFLVWGIPLFCGLFLSPIIRPTFRANVPTCLPACLHEYQNICRAINFLLFIFTLLIGGVIPSVLYTWMYKRGRKLKPKIAMGTFAANLVVSTTVAGNHLATPNMNEVNRERRTLMTLILLYLTVLLTSFPQYLIVLLRGIHICAFFKIPIMVHFMLSDVFFSSTALDPIVLLRNQDFREAFWDFFFLKLKRRMLAQADSSLVGSSPGLSDATSL